jgi:uncharacterized protein (TIGR02145 family)
LVASDGTTTQTVSGTTLATSALTITPTVIRDMTGCPGVFCIYSGSDLYIDATHLCQQRTSGAKNWQAYIRDSRDSEIYRIVLMPDGKWWLAQNVKLASYNGSTVGSAINGCTKDECGRAYTWAQTYASYAGGTSGSSGNVQGICPPGWLLPIRATYSTLANSIGSASDACAALRCYSSSCTPVNDTYGWASKIAVVNGNTTTTYAYMYTNDTGREDGFGIDIKSQGNFSCGDWIINNPGDSGNPAGGVRCYRQL